MLEIVETTRDKHRQNVVSILEELLEEAKRGDIVAITGVVEYPTSYKHISSGYRNSYSMLGAHAAAMMNIYNSGE